jgi:hypothetical protein
VAAPHLCGGVCRAGGQAGADGAVKKFKPQAMLSNINYLRTLSEPPTTDLEDWLSDVNSSLNFLNYNSQNSSLVIYASLPHVLIHGLLAPTSLSCDSEHHKATTSHIFPSHKWRIEHASGGGLPDRVYLADPLKDTVFEGGEKLIFTRSFDGRDPVPTEVSQKLIHALDLHFIQTRSAYCRLDEHGDLEDVISLIKIPEQGKYSGGLIITILQADLHEYMALANLNLAVLFDFTRFRLGSFTEWDHKQPINHKSTDLHFHGTVMPKQASYINGCQIIRPRISVDEIVQKKSDAYNPRAREYAVFKAYDLKSGKLVETSCALHELSNYFQPESPLPLDLSPAFFRAEVLQKYKSNPDKYVLTDRDIYCKGTWHLTTYDINDEGQVHTYLKYLSYLPYTEQLYWKSFNEEPKGFLSNRAIQTDFRGEWDTTYSPLESLKRKIRRLDERAPIWWQPRGDQILSTIHYPTTNSSLEWGNEILCLDQILVEGFKETVLKGIAIQLNRKIEPEWRSIKFIQEILIGSGMPETEAQETIAPLKELRGLRNVLRGHLATQKKEEIINKALTDHSSFRRQFESIAQKCDAAIDIITQLLPK